MRRVNPFLFNNPSPNIRPIGAAKFGLFRSLVQHTLPLAGGLATIEAGVQGIDSSKIAYGWDVPYFVDFSEAIDFTKINSQRFYDSFKKIGAISAVTGAGWWAAQYSPWGQSVSNGATKSKWLTTEGLGIGNTRVGQTFRAQVWTTIASFAALRIWDTIERKQHLLESGKTLRKELAYALNRHNEYLTRLENGEDIPPEKVAESTMVLKQTAAQYRKFMEVLEHQEGDGKYEPLGLENDHQDEYDRMKREQGWFSGGMASGSGEYSANVYIKHQQRLRALRSRETRLAARLDRIHGLSHSSGSDSPESMRDFLKRKIQGGQNPEPSSGPAHSPIDLNHYQTQIILRDFRHQAAKDPKFVHQSPQEKAEYILNEFSGFRVAQADGSRRPWNLEEAKAFIQMVEQENFRRQNNLEEPLTRPQDGFDPKRFGELAEKEAQILDEERVWNHHLQKNFQRLENNVTDFDRQMRDYHQKSETRLHQALRHFAPKSYRAQII